MKIKIKSLRREERTFYFNHKYGTVRKKITNRTAVAGSVMSAMLVIGGTGVLVNAGLNYRDSRAKQLDSVASSQETKPAAQAAEDNLVKAPVKAREDAQLAKDIKTKLKNTPGGQKWSVYVRDLNSDRMASINADNELNGNGVASLFTLAPLESKMPSANWNYRAGKSTIAKCVEDMVKTNSADCARSVGQYADLKNADSINEGLGFKKTSLTDKSQTTTARETGELLFRLQNGQLLSDKARRIVFDGLYGQKVRDGIAAGCDQKCLVANTVFESKDLRTDAAIVTSDKAKYIVVIATNNASWSQIADVAASIRLNMQP